MFDDQEDLETWGKVPMLLALIEQYFGELVFTPADKARTTPNGWPTLGQMVAMGKRVIFANGEDYGPDMAPYIFYKYGAQFSNWTEVDPKVRLPCRPCRLAAADAARAGPAALPRVHAGRRRDADRPHHPRGVWCVCPPQLRPAGALTACADSLVYGPFWNGTADGQLDVESLPAHTACAVNWPSMDQARPDLVAAGLWAWDRDEPQPAACAAATAASARWRTAPCGAALPYACAAADGGWLLSGSGAPTVWRWVCGLTRPAQGPGRRAAPQCVRRTRCTSRRARALPRSACTPL
jgi:hypothetical protein